MKTALIAAWAIGAAAYLTDLVRRFNGPWGLNVHTEDIMLGVVLLIAAALIFNMRSRT